ncbi:hypothetical protein MX659_02290 [Coriobacteriia bacterium Es71-Z0120]|uniref:hypothetical protein n=1 Tax=Parvivirga hydrogeniphila TaxID=2939460 RepID=UPI002260ED84|nr:hypothetical protein [Parvivirga hydrogeniphila]MCL4078433.1 hypothetical protein [Parvivirga hydrogeniphila]
MAKAPGKQRDKNLVVVYADEKQSVPATDLSATIKKAVEARGYTLLEDVNIVQSSCATPGVLLADVIAYLSMWVYAGHKAASAQASLFDGNPGSVPKHLEQKLHAVSAILERGSGVSFVPKLK